MRSNNGNFLKLSKCVYCLKETTRNLFKVSKLKNVAKRNFFIYCQTFVEKQLLTCCNKVLNLLKSCWSKKRINLAKRNQMFKSPNILDTIGLFSLQINLQVPCAWWTKRTINPASLMVLAAVGVGARNLLCISVETRKPSVARCSRKFLLELSLLIENTIIILFLTQIYQLFLW